ncbi:MAG: phytoene desaturase family protein [Myxococcota bacterium]
MKPTPDYDAIVIGSGSGGLTAGLALARAGRRVAVFEQHTLPGGYSQSFELEGFLFSPGIHYIGQLGPGERLRVIYEGLGIANDLVFLELNPDGYDRVFVGENRFDIPKGRERFRERLRDRFPAEARGIDGYFEAVRKISEELAWARPPTNLSDAARLPFRLPTVLRFGLEPLERFLDRFVSDPLVRAILSIQSGDHGMAPSRAPTALHAGLQSYYFDGACYPRGGGRSIPEAMTAHIRSHGGEVFLGTEVDRILVEAGRARGVRLSDGQEVSADVVVSNADPGVTWGQLVDPTLQGARLRRRIGRLHYSVSALSLFLAVDLDLRAAGLDSGNVWYSRTPDIGAAYRAAETRDLSNLDATPGLFFNVTTLKDPSLREDGLHTVEALALSTPRAFRAWRDSEPGARGAVYEALKERISKLILAEVDRFVPGFSERVVFHSLGTPLTNMHFMHATDGGIYGTEKTWRNLGPFGFPIRTHLKGLFQCGASTFAPGIHGVTTSGLAAAAAALGCEDDELLTASGQELRIYPADDPDRWPVELRPRKQ